MEIKIRKAKVLRNGCVEATYIDADGNVITMNGYNICHQDLINAINRLVPYFADLTEQREADLIDWNDLESDKTKELLNMLSVSGVSRGDSIITMTGKRTLLTRRVLNLNAPGVEIDNEAFDWELLDSFIIDVDNFFYEVKEYIVNRKWSKEQGTLDFGNNEDPFANAPENATPAEAVA